MRSFVLSAVSAAAFLLLLCALSGAPAAAQSGCTTTYNCQGNSGCISVMGSNVTHRSITEYTDQASCDAGAKSIMASQPLPTIQCSCGGSGSTSSDLGSNIGQLVSTMSPQQQMGAAVGAVGTLMILKGLSEMMSGPAPDPAAQQRALAAQQLNNSGIYLLKQKNYAGAINEFQQALAQTPNDRNIANNLALAKQQQANAALAGRTSGILGQVLGTPQPSTGPAGSNSPLGLVNLNANADNSNRNAAQPQGGSQASTQSVENQIDGALGNAPVQAAPASAQEIDQLFASTQPTPNESQVHAQQQVDDLFKNPGGTTPDAAALGQQASLGQTAAAAKTNEDASAMAGQGFDTAAPSVAVPVPSVATPAATVAQVSAPQTAAVAALPTTAASALDATPAKQMATPASAPVVVADLKRPPAPAPEYAITPMHEVTRGAAAPGSPIFDCEGDHAVIQRMASGLPAQDEAIRRTEKAMKAAKEDSADEQKEIRDAAASTMLASATLTTEWARAAIAKAASLQSKGIGPNGDLFKELTMMKDLLKDGDALKELLTTPAKARKAYDAGYDYGDTVAVEQNAKTLRDQWAATMKFLKDSGIYEKALENGGEHFALMLGGPVGEAEFKTFVSAMDLGIHMKQAWDSAAEADQAEHDLTVMDDQLRMARERIYELQQEVITGCPRMTTAGN
jgi:tetratricopeptide (TPR) repeat protein